MKLNIIGLGYIGLPTSLIFASRGIQVVGTDINERLVNTLNHNQVTFEEEGLIDLYNEAKSNGIKFSTEYDKADVYIITVPTPYIKETKKLDPSYIIDAVNTILDICDDNTIVVVESTVSPGTIENSIRPLINAQEKNIRLVHAPERILPGAMISELVNNSRTIGADDKETGEIILNLYKSFCEGDIVLTDIPSAEMSKVVENTYRDINIAFANELLQICNEAGLDVNEVIRIANMHPRVNILSPGPGVGGHCISVDPWFLVGDYPELTKLILKAREINDSMPRYVLNRILEIMKEKNISDFSKVGFYGIAYKENVDDTRESPTLQLLDILSEDQLNAKFYDPMINNTIIDNQYHDFNDFISNIELLVVMVGHTHILNTNISAKISILDTKNILQRDNKFNL